MTDDRSMAAPTGGGSPDVSEELVSPGREMMFGYDALSSFLPAQRSVDEPKITTGSAGNADNDAAAASGPVARRWVAQMRHRPGRWLGRMAAGKGRPAA